MDGMSEGVRGAEGSGWTLPCHMTIPSRHPLTTLLPRHRAFIQATPLRSPHNLSGSASGLDCIAPMSKTNYQ